MAPRGTRRPHARRVRSKPVKVKRRSGGGGNKGGICDMAVLAPASMLLSGAPLVVMLMVTR